MVEWLAAHEQLNATGKRVEDIRKIMMRTHEAAIRGIDKMGPLNNPADRDPCMQCMIAVPLIRGRLTAADYAPNRKNSLVDDTACVHSSRGVERARCVSRRTPLRTVQAHEL
jgi:2-methylcitrate dehydratase